jgi:ribosomal protein L11 methyltransferase
LSVDPGRPAITWKVSLPCTRAEAEAVKDDLPALAMLDSPPVLMTSEKHPERPDEWRLDAYFDSEPDRGDLALLRALAPSARTRAPAVEALSDEDWVTLSQQGLEPIRAGRFLVCTPAHKAEAPSDAITFEIDAGQAFGTGHHETTTGCLIALDRLKRGGASFANILDLGTGTGLLAFAALRLWPHARVAASDIDPVAIAVTAENGLINAIPTGRARGQLALAVAAGIDHSMLKARAPYDLIIANILAGPLVEMAPSIAAALAPGGRLILAGLLDRQASAVATAYRRGGLMTAATVQRGEWPCLVMRKRRRTKPTVRYQRTR